MTDDLLNQIKRLTAKKIKMKNGKTYEQNLLHEARRLKMIIRRHLDMARNVHIPDLSANPYSYERTGDFPHSLKVEDIVNMRIVGNTIELDVYFDPAGAVRPSGFGIKSLATTIDESGRPQLVPWRSEGEVNIGLIYEFGYKVNKDVWFKNIPYFGYRSGTRFLSNAIDEFLADNPYGIRVSCPALGLYPHRKFSNA